ncbi:hypothetical protein BST13_33250 [Mycobacterium aquaticum]|uniref:Uncharacterized protein n=2 Tax=Mycobacterium aquaticum TaxID=1927124 RepID=A0A1X0A555_9MYCO|nr:hypothetical protein BST13_33250 [Mycobacterium aquaticum]
MPEPAGGLSAPKSTGDGAVAQRIADLQHGAQLLRDHADRIGHRDLVALVADWIDAEALMWETTQQIVSIIKAAATVEISGGRAGKVHFGVADGKPQTVIDTSTHADRIIAAISEELAR